MAHRKFFSILGLLAFSLSALYAVKLTGQTAVRKDGSGRDVIKKATGRISTDDTRDGDYILTVGRRSQRLSGISTQKLSAAKDSPSIKAYGEVLDLQQLTSLVTSYEAAKAASMKSIFQLEISRNKYTRARLLFRSTKYVSLEQLQDARAAFYSDLADSESAFENLSGLKGQIMEEWGERISNLAASSSSFMRRLMSNEISMMLVTIQEPARSYKAPGTALVRAIDGNLIEAHLISMSPVSNPQIQGVSYFYEAPSSSSLPAGTNIVAYLDGGKKMSGVSVPSSAVVWYNGTPWIFLKTGAESFVRKGISLTIPTAKGWFIDKGVKPGEEVVVNGAQLLLSQELIGHAHGNDD